MQCRLIALLLLLLSLPARGDVAPPAWQTLVFEKRNLLGIARAEVAIRTSGECTDAGWRMIVDNTLPGMRETVDLTLACTTGAVLLRQRFSQGRDKRLLAWHYDEHAVIRERREPVDAGDGSGRRPEQWPISSRRRIEVPTPGKDSLLTSPYGLLALLDLVVDEATATRLVVHTDWHFYRLAVSRERQDLGLGAPLPWGEHELRGVREVDRLTLRAEPLDGESGESDFTLFGLGGKIVLDIDARTRLPLRIRGSAPRIGTATLRLIAAVPAPTRDGPQPGQR